MNLKYRFALLFSFFVFIILTILFVSIYYFCEDFRKDDFIIRLRTDALNQYEIYKAIPSQQKIDEIKKNRVISLYNERVIIFDSTYSIVYSNPSVIKDIYRIKLLKTSRKKGEVIFRYKDGDAVAISSGDNFQQYYIVAAAYDKYGVRKMRNLRNILISSLMGGLILSALFAFFFARQIMKPVSDLNEQMQGITESNLNARVEERGKNDELARIAKSFNSMLNRLQQAFEMQKSFVHHASHELRTPIASMLSQTEAALGKDLPVEEYKRVLDSLREDQVDMSELINALLLLSQYEALTTIKDWVPVRVDEVMYETIEVLKEVYPDASINLNFVTLPDNSNYLTIKGNEVLIKTAIGNLIKNAYLYSSDKKVSISIDADEKGIEVIFENKGVHLAGEEKESLFIPFFRGVNAGNVKGTGLGLAIVQRIVTLHNGRVQYQAAHGNINRFILSIPT